MLKKLLLVCAVMLLSFNSNAENIYNAVISNDEGVIKVYDIKLAINDQQREKGLMFVRHMNENFGMMFIWKNVRQRAMWMKNTYIPLDMLFIKDDTIVGIIENAEPETLKIRTVYKEVDKILEINAGQVKKYNIEVGNKVTLKDREKNAK